MKSTKAELILFIKTAILGGTYVDSAANNHIFTAISAIKQFGIWNNQIANAETLDNIVLPSVWFEFNRSNNNSRQAQTAPNDYLHRTTDKVFFTLHLLYPKLNAEDRIIDYLDVLDLAYLLISQIENKKTQDIGNVLIDNETTDHNSTVFMDHKIQFTTILNNLGESSAIDASNLVANPNAPVEVNLTVLRS